MSYSIGEPAYPVPDDARFETREEAEVKAIELSCTMYYDATVLAVWEDDGGEVLALVFRGIVYTS